jgi:hypothetical protein
MYAGRRRNLPEMPQESATNKPGSDREETHSPSKKSETGGSPPGVFPLPMPKRKTGKHPGWATLKTPRDAELALQRLYNLLIVGDTKAEVPPGTPPPKIDPQEANAGANLLRTWLTAHTMVNEAKLDEVVETNEMMLRLLEQRGIDPKGGGSRNH